MKPNVFRLSQILFEGRAWLVVVFQAVLILLSLVSAWVLRFEFNLPDPGLLFSAAPLLILIRIAFIRIFNLHHGWWRYAGVSEAMDVLKATALGSCSFWILMRVVLQVTSFPRSVYILEAFLSAGLLIGARLFSRALAESVWRDLTESKAVVIIGAGLAADMVIRESKRAGSGYKPVFCVDDNRSKHGIRIHGVPVLGSVDQLPNLVSQYCVDEAVIAVPSATGTQMRRFVDACRNANLRFRTVPCLREIISGKVPIGQFREVNLEDLLGRDPIQIDLKSVRKHIEGKRVIVTGAAGSIGSELCRQILDYGPGKLICVDQSETGVFYLRQELSSHKNGAQLDLCVADVRDRKCMWRILTEHTPQLMFHAAAYKHVPIMETNVHAAVNNNVFALLDLLELAEGGGCESFVLISSDKAVNPTSVMGATKRVCELILSSRPSKRMRCVSVRFGNVLGSNGSVVPVLREQLRNNQPLTVTHPDIKRFFMTTREAVALVLQAFAIGTQGDILVLDMGEPVRILDLARSLIRLSGKTEEDVPIRITGLREGEKLQEELFYASERVEPTSCEKIKRVKTISNGWSVLKQELEGLRAAVNANGTKAVRAQLKEIVPEYTGTQSDFTDTPEEVKRLETAIARMAAASD